jgi:NADPH:quinone reductase-like Zn-dependent oxidoreductase
MLAPQFTPVPHAGPGQVRIAVRAASVNPADWKQMTGVMSGGQPMAGTGALAWDYQAGWP